MDDMTDEVFADAWEEGEDDDIVVERKWGVIGLSQEGVRIRF